MEYWELTRWNFCWYGAIAKFMRVEKKKKKKTPKCFVCGKYNMKKSRIIVERKINKNISLYVYVYTQIYFYMRWASEWCFSGVFGFPNNLEWVAFLGWWWWCEWWAYIVSQGGIDCFRVVYLWLLRKMLFL